jgi:hypothetical protein
MMESFLADLPLNTANNIKSFTRTSGAGAKAVDTLERAAESFAASDIEALERAFAHEPAKIGNITNALVATPKVFPTTMNRVAASATAAGAINDMEGQKRFAEFEQHLPTSEKTFSGNAADFADNLQAKTEFMNAPRNAIFSLSPINAMFNLMQGKVQPDYATVAFGVGTAGTAMGWLNNGTRMLGNLTTKPLQAVGNFLSSKGEKLVQKEGVLSSIGAGTVSVGNASTATGTLLKEKVVEKLVGTTGTGSAATIGALGHVESKLKTVSKAMGAPERFAYSANMNDMMNIPSSAAAQVGTTLNELGMQGAANKTIDMAHNLRDKEVAFGASAKEFLSKASDKLSSVVGAVAGAGAAEKTKDGLSALGTGIANKNMMQVANQTAAVSSIAVQGVRDVSFMTRSVERLVEMYADMKGVDVASVSPVKALFDLNVTASVSKARGNLIKTVGLGAFASAASAAATWKVASTVRGMQGMGAVIGITMLQAPVRNMVFSQDPLLDSYSEVRDNFQKTGTLELQSVAKLVTTASPTLRKTQSVDDVYALAQHYIDKQYTPGQLMIEIDNGGIAATMFEIKNEAFKADAVAKAKAEMAASDAATPKTATSDMQHDGRVAEKLQQHVAGA